MGKPTSRNNIVKTYLIGVFLWSYTFLVSAAIISNLYPGAVRVRVLHLIGGAGPFVAALYCISIKRNFREYAGRLFRLGNVPLLSWIIALSPLLVIPASILAAGSVPRFDDSFVEAGIPYALFLLIFGPLPEEMGWRGVLFEGIYRKSFVEAQTVTAVAWLLWHLPLFFIVGSYQNDLGFLTIPFYIWAATLVVQSVLMGYMYVMSGGSIALAVIFHYLVNLTGEAFAMDVKAGISALII